VCAPADKAPPVISPRDVTLPSCRVRAVVASPHEPVDRGTLLLLHGGHGGWPHWGANIEPLARAGHRVIAPDMPGFGASGDLSAPSVATIAQAIGELLDALAARAVTAVGFSFGCLVTAALAQQRPDVVARVLLINPPGLGTRSAAAREIQQAITVTALNDGERAGITQTLKQLLLSRHELIDDAMIDAALQMAQRMRFYSRDVSRAANLMPTLQALAQPLQVLLGALDPHQNHELEERCARVRAARGGQPDAARVVPEAAHWLQRDRADWFNQHVARFHQGRSDAAR
jgi:2-hydroxy-6-oxonona-2,4-dienedioate hydrolase